MPVHKFDSSGEKTNTPVLFQKGKQQKQTTLAVLAEQVNIYIVKYSFSEISESIIKINMSRFKRGELLGETPLNAPARSVFDYVSRKDKDRLDNLIGYMIDTVGETKKKQSNEIEIPKVDKNVALAALQGFIPFESDKKKQARYKQFLEMQAELSVVPLKKPEVKSFIIKLS